MAALKAYFVKRCLWSVVPSSLMMAHGNCQPSLATDHVFEARLELLGGALVWLSALNILTHYR